MLPTQMAGDALSFLKYAVLKTRHSLDSLGGTPELVPGKVRTLMAFTLSGIGNTIMFTPTLVNLRKAFPDARLICVVGPRSSDQVVSGSPYVDEVIVQPMFKRLGEYPNFIRFMEGLKARRPDLTVHNFLSVGPYNAMMAYQTGAAWRVGHIYGPDDPHWKRYFAGFEDLFTTKVPVVENRHEVELNLDLVRAMGLRARRAPQFFWTEDEHERFADALLEENGLRDRLLVGFHPGTHTDMTFKRWDPGRFAQVARRVARELGGTALVFGSSGERDLARRIIRDSGLNTKGPGPVEAMNLCGKMDLKRSAALISRCRTFVSNDSGLMHVAAARKVPVVAVFGPTDHRRTSPWGKGHIVVRTGEDCSPCYVRSGTRVDCPHQRCLRDLTVEMVWEGVERRVRLV